MSRSTTGRGVLERWTWIPLVIGVLVATFLLLNHTAALGQTATDLLVRDTKLAPDGTTEIVVNLTGQTSSAELPAQAFAVSENGAPIERMEVTPLLETGQVPDVTVWLVLDISSSMDGAPLEEVKAAADRAIDVLTEQGVAVGLITFETFPEIVATPSRDPDELREPVEQLEARGTTALYDAILMGVRQVAGGSAQGNLLIIADGEDNASDATEQDAIDAAEQAGVPLVVLALETDRLDVGALEPLAAETGGRLERAATTTEIGAVFERTVTDISNQYVLRYTSPETTGDTLSLAVQVDVGDDQPLEIAYAVANVRDDQPLGIGPSTRVADPGWFSGGQILLVGALAGFAALLVLFALLFTGQRTVADRRLGDQLSRYIEANDRRAGRSGAVAAHFRDRAFELFETAPGPKGSNDKLTIKLEQAAWPLRNGEFRVLVFLSGLAAAMVGAVFFNLVGGLLLGVLCGFIPIVILENRRTKRQDAFLADLPDTLQLMAGSLRAGYGVMQAVDTVAKEASEPTSEEFTRVLTEARLGMPVEDALEAMADRIDSSDLRWVVLAINIQREVGGNLAELLDTVAEVLREREMMRRQIKVLSAEGRLSAVILIMLPIFLALYLVLVRPMYVGELVTNGLIGYLMIGGAVLLMAVGTLWIRSMIRIEV